jgi:hypothetical protein
VKAVPAPAAMAAMAARTIVPPASAPAASRTAIAPAARTAIAPAPRAAIPPAASAPRPLAAAPRPVSATRPPADLTRSSFARNLLPADQTQQLRVMPETAPAAKILREVRDVQRQP